MEAAAFPLLNLRHMSPSILKFLKLGSDTRHHMEKVSGYLRVIKWAAVHWWHFLLIWTPQAVLKMPLKRSHAMLKQKAEEKYGHHIPGSTRKGC